MKRKLSCIALILASIFVFVACTNDAIRSSQIDNEAPWQAAWDVGKLEKTTYSITKELVSVNTDTRVKVAEGKASYTISDATSSELDNINNQSRTRVEFEFGLDYNEDAPEIDRNKHDSITSNTIVSSISMSPIYSKREVKLDLRTNAGTTVDNSHTIETNYIDKSSTMTTNDNNSDTIKFDGANLRSVIDNESLFVAIRAFRYISELSKSIAIYVATPRDFFDWGNYATHNMSVVTGSQLVHVHLKDGLKIDGLQQDEDHQQDGYKSHYVDAIEVALGITGTSLTGLPTALYYAAQPIYLGKNNDDSLRLHQIHDDSTTSDPAINKLLVRFTTQRYVNNNTIELLTFDLIDYEL
ncbi:MAG: hypothetical protein LBK70_00255 [Clostridiales bacterium]|jgi:hypothetical protein|nr:hypothetical protein [Clostridiales bacterium]